MQNENPWDKEVFIIAEMSANHANDINIAIKTIEAAAKAGANAIKTQLFTAESLGIPDRKKSPLIEDKSSPWFQEKLYDLYNNASMPYEWYPRLKKCAELNNIILFGSVFDTASVDFALKNKFNFIKISSFEIIHEPLLRKVASKGIPSIISTGMATLTEIEKAHNIFREQDCIHCFLKCTSNYPASIEDTHIRLMKTINDRFKVPVGLSDHSLSNLPSVMAVALGGRIIEKHIILDKNIESVDNFFSLDKNEFQNLVEDIRNAEKLIKKTTFDQLPSPSEMHSHWERPSIYYSRILNKGEILKESDLIIRRPSLGLKPEELKNIIGKKINRTVEQYQATSIQDFEQNN